jgi:hypothetical protein
MDSQIVNEKSLAFKNRVLRLTPAQFDQLGLVKKHIHLKIEEFQLSCIPFDLSLTKASLLAFLSEKEIAFFKKFIDKPQKFYVSHKSPYSVKPVTFFLISKILSFRKIDPASPYCFIDVTFISVPLVFKELLVTYFMGNDESERFFAEAPDVPLSAEQVMKAFGSIHLSLMKDGCTAERLRIVGLSAKTLKVFGEFDGSIPAQNEIVEFEPFEGDSACILKGECTVFAPSTDSPGFGRLEVKLAFTPYAFGRIREAVGWGGKAARGGHTA